MTKLFSVSALILAFSFGASADQYNMNFNDLTPEEKAEFMQDFEASMDEMGLSLDDAADMGFLSGALDFVKDTVSSVVSTVVKIPGKIINTIKNLVAGVVGMVTGGGKMPCKDIYAEFEEAGMSDKKDMEDALRAQLDGAASDEKETLEKILKDCF